MELKDYNLTEYSHGAGCGCKLSPGVLAEIIGANSEAAFFENLMVGNDTKDDAAIVGLDGKTGIISTTDFFMPIVDDPVDFGAIAATNAISDIYAMGGEPLMAIAILGWPINKIPATVAAKVLEGGRKICTEAGIALAGGHSIDAPEPIFGLAVTGKIAVDKIKRNKDGKTGDLLYLTKPLGIGMVATAQKRKLVEEKDLEQAVSAMTTLNTIGKDLSGHSFVHAMTDVTGFGLVGHLLEICEASNLSAFLEMDKIPVFEFAQKYRALKCIPGGTHRNWKTYGSKISLKNPLDFELLADPQTSGGLLVSVDPDYKMDFESFMSIKGFQLEPIGRLANRSGEQLISVE